MDGLSLLRYRRDQERSRRSRLDAIVNEVPRDTPLDDVRRAYIENVVVRCEGNKTHAAKWLGITVRTLRSYFNGGKK